MIRGIHHVACNTPNFDRMLEFYKGLGFQQITENNGVRSPAIDDIVGLKDAEFRVAMLRAGNMNLELFEYASPAARGGERLRPCDHGYTHICLDATDIEAEWDRLTALGMTFHRRPVDFGVVKTIYGKDPDGNVIELQEVVSPDDPMALEQLEMLKL